MKQTELGHLRMYQTGAHIRKKYDVSGATLRRWADSGILRHVRYGGKGMRLYHAGDLQKHFGAGEEVSDTRKTKKIIYARVSSAHQKADLQRQIQDLQAEFPDHEVISDVASGLNFKRRGLITLLEHVNEGLVQEIVVMHKDRLCRYGYELLEFIFKKAGTKCVVHSKHETTPDAERELADDLLAITTVFVARHNGRRSAENRRRRKRTRAICSQKDSSVSDSGTEKETQHMVRRGALDVQQVCGKSKKADSDDEQENAAAITHQKGSN